MDARPLALVLVAAALAACPGLPLEILPRIDAALADTSGLSPDAAILADTVLGSPCAVPVGDPRHEAIETRCDGLDNDCDGLVDVLLPLGPNACTTDRPGACHLGWAACQAGVRTCLAPSPTPEVSDGTDNDCDGVVDNVLPADVHPRALVLVPSYLWKDSAAEIGTITSTLDQWGVPYDSPPVGSDWTAALGALAGHALAVVPGYLTGDVVGEVEQAALEAFVRQGGVLVITKPIGDARSPGALRLAGLASSASHQDVTRIRIEGLAAPLVAFDSPEERDLVLTTSAPGDSPVEVYAMQPDPAAGTTVLARAFAGDQAVGAAITRRPLGRGAVYALGHDLHTYGTDRCYINCFEPGADLVGLFLRDALREAALGHVVLKHTVAGLADSVLLLTHDLDAPDSHNAGPWGAAGGLQMAQVERAHHARGTYYVTTDYIVGYYNPQTVQDLCALGMCPVGAHSVRHLNTFGTQNLGTCMETRATYGPGTRETLCGEVRVSMQILQDLTGTRPSTWRSPLLIVHPMQFDVLAANGIASDSSFAVGDVKYNLPVALAANGLRQDLFHHQPIYEFPIAAEDGIGGTVNGVATRTELQASNLPRFITNWTYLMLRNAANRAYTTALIHPSYGQGVGYENLPLKMTAADRLLGAAEAAGVPTSTVPEVTEFWRGRAGTALDATFATGTGYRGTLRVGAAPVTDLTLEFGDVLRDFQCAACGRFELSGRRVVLHATLAPGTAAEFTALAR